MTSLSNKLLLTQPNTNTDHTTKKSGFTSFHDNLNNEFKLGSFQTKNNVTVLAPAHRVMGPSQYGGAPQEDWRPPVNAFLKDISSTASEAVDQIEKLSHSVDLTSLNCRDLQSAILYPIQLSIWGASGSGCVSPSIQFNAAVPAWRI